MSRGILPNEDSSPHFQSFCVRDAIRAILNSVNSPGIHIRTCLWVPAQSSILAGSLSVWHRECYGWSSLKKLTTATHLWPAASGTLPRLQFFNTSGISWDILELSVLVQRSRFDSCLYFNVSVENTSTSWRAGYMGRRPKHV